MSSTPNPLSFNTGAPVSSKLGNSILSTPFLPNPVPLQVLTKAAVFANAVEGVMKNNTPDSYRFVVMNDHGVVKSGSGGFSRHAVDAPEVAARTDDRFNICSMSKVITATAVLALLQQKNLTPDALVAPFLPPDWTLSDEVRQLTFRDFMTHTTGFHWDSALNVFQDASDYAGMKAIFAQKPYNPIKAAYDYRNINFAIFRVVLNYLNGYDRFTRKSNFTVPPNASADQFTAVGYVELVNKVVLVPAGVAAADCNNDTIHHADGNPQSVWPVLSYAFHDNTSHGIDPGNALLSSGPQGWCLSVLDVAQVLQTVLFSEVILSEKSRGYLLSGVPNSGTGCGLDRLGDMDGSPVYLHGAYIPFTSAKAPGDAMLAGWCYYFQNSKLIAVALSNTGHDPIQQNIRNWDGRTTDAFTQAFAPGSPGL